MWQKPHFMKNRKKSGFFGDFQKGGFFPLEIFLWYNIVVRKIFAAESTT